MLASSRPTSGGQGSGSFLRQWQPPQKEPMSSVTLRGSQFVWLQCVPSSEPTMKVRGKGSPHCLCLVRRPTRDGAQVADLADKARWDRAEQAGLAPQTEARKAKLRQTDSRADGRVKSRRIIGHLHLCSPPTLSLVPEEWYTHA